MNLSLKKRSSQLMRYNDSRDNIQMRMPREDKTGEEYVAVNPRIIEVKPQ